jgi:lipoic acid synthetase
VRAALRDLRAVGVEIVTLGQYLQPTAQHLPIARWWTPAEFDAIRVDAEAMGFAHVEAGPLVRSSYHAREGIDRPVGAAVGAAAIPG